MTLRAVSYGGGVQSTALLVLAAQRRIDYPLFLFANVGDDSESPATLDYIHDVAMPYAAEHGIELVELRRIMQRGPEAGAERTLLQEIRGQDRTIPIPVRIGNGGFGRRKCTSLYKIDVVRRELRRRGASADDPATVAIGISTDEIERAGAGAGPDPRDPTRNRSYPLLDLRLSRQDCRSSIIDAGLPVPPKSACWFCPFNPPEAWRRMRRDEPEQWETAVALDALIRERSIRVVGSPMGLANSKTPLEAAVGDQPQLPGMDGDGCDSGWCMT